MIDDPASRPKTRKKKLTKFESDSDGSFTESISAGSDSELSPPLAGRLPAVEYGPSGIDLSREPDDYDSDSSLELKMIHSSMLPDADMPESSNSSTVGPYFVVDDGCDHSKVLDQLELQSLADNQEKIQKAMLALQAKLSRSMDYLQTSFYNQNLIPS